MGRKIDFRAASRQQQGAGDTAPKCAATPGATEADNSRRHPSRERLEPMRPAIPGIRVTATTSRHRPHRRHPVTEALRLSSLIFIRGHGNAARPGKYPKAQMSRSKVKCTDYLY